jgi:hypothetical protein
MWFLSSVLNHHWTGSFSIIEDRRDLFHNLTREDKQKKIGKEQYITKQEQGNKRHDNLKEDKTKQGQEARARQER